MINEELVKLKKRLGDGKAWIEKIKAQGTYGQPETRRGIDLFCLLGDQVLAEDSKRAAAQPEEHSKAWMGMLEREAKDEERRERNRIAARERAERKRKGIK